MQFAARRLLTLACLAVLLTACGEDNATRDRAQVQPGAVEPDSSSVNPDAVEVEEAVDYWTPERMRKAKPADEVLDPPGGADGPVAADEPDGPHAGIDGER